MTEARRELAGKVAIVTGGSRGIGLACAHALADAGARIALVARDEARASEAARSLPGSGHQGYGCDVRDPDAVARVVDGIESDLGAVGILVNNAGITRDGLLVRMKDEDWDEVLATNLKGAFLFTRALTKGMMRRREGAIVNVSSVIGLMGNAGQANYAASKAGLIGFTKSVAKELAPRGIRANAVAPGYIETDMTAGLGDSASEELRKRIPLGRLGVVGDIAGVVRFLAGPDASYITGQVIAVDGGMVM